MEIPQRLRTPHFHTHIVWEEGDQGVKGSIHIWISWMNCQWRQSIAVCETKIYAAREVRGGQGILERSRFKCEGFLSALTDSLAPFSFCRPSYAQTTHLIFDRTAIILTFGSLHLRTCLMGFTEDRKGNVPVSCLLQARILSFTLKVYSYCTTGASVLKEVITCSD